MSGFDWIHGFGEIAHNFELSAQACKISPSNSGWYDRCVGRTRSDTQMQEHGVLRRDGPCHDGRSPSREKVLFILIFRPFWWKCEAQPGQR